jgi:5-methylthioadenosine/S-adenosylhomocysteine deaminase
MTTLSDPTALATTVGAAPRRLLVRGATLLTVDPLLGDLPSGDVLVENGTIVAVGPALSAGAGDALVLDATGTIALPGFVDAHVHAWEAQLRGTAPDADFGAYLGLTAFGAGPRYRPEDVEVGTLATSLTALDAGTTTIVDNAHLALTPDHARAGIEGLLRSGIRGVHAVGSPFGVELDHVPATALALREEYRDPRISVRLFEVHPTASSWAFARDHDLWVSTELGPHTPDVDDVLAGLERHGLLSPRHTFNHCYDLAPVSWDRIAASGASVNLSPRSDATFGLGTTVTPAAHALTRGVPTGLSGDNEVSYGLSMFAELAALHSRYRSEGFRAAVSGDAQARPTLTPAELLRMATQGGADNAGLGDVVGSLTPGKQADLVLVRADDVNLRGIRDPRTAVVAYAHAGNVDTVLVGGRLRKWHGVLVGVDVDRCHAELDRSRERLLDPQPVNV